jgi:hypothetical protein
MIALANVAKGILIAGTVAVVGLFGQTTSAAACNPDPAPGSLLHGQRVTVPNSCRCKGRTLTVIGGDTRRPSTGELKPDAQRYAGRQYICK